MPKDRRSRDKKRKDKLAKRNQKQRQSTSLAYMGEKYKTDELIPIWMQTEIGIYETFVLTDRELLDGTVVIALERLIKKIRVGTLPPVTDDAEIRYEAGQEEELRRWGRQKWSGWTGITTLRSLLGRLSQRRLA